MTPEEIRKTFALDPADGKTLTSQLEGAISRFIESHCDGTFLPPEEHLARDLNVSRVTVRNALKKFLEAGETFDEIFVIGPLIMMKFVAALTKEYGIKTTVSMNPIMIDGTGMCGGCRLTLNRDGKRVTEFACVSGPDFNGYEVDFDEAMRRQAMYRGKEMEEDHKCRIGRGRR